MEKINKSLDEKMGIDPKECNFFKMCNKIMCCDHKDNSDNRSRKMSGRMRKCTKRCEPKFCPFNKIKLEFEI